MKPLVIDTNVSLDLCVFADPTVAPLRQALAQGPWRWLATSAMREELQRVLGYPLVARRLQADGRTPEAALACWDAAVSLVWPAPKAPYTCKDKDDQIFIDLAVHHQARLLSKDKAVLCMARRLARLNTEVLPRWPTPAPVASAAIPFLHSVPNQP
ncbi:MAG: tRNA(fMet)-specific endonuclease VapC [Pseudomonadota bacterium]|jgi:predicted nucleic acid-binding protein